MKILNHRLYSDTGEAFYFQQTPNISEGKIKEIKFIVIHYDAYSKPNSGLNWMLDERSKVSAHIHIDRGGKIKQLAEFNAVAWHAGNSQYNGYKNINHYGIGIELENAGVLDAADGKVDKWCHIMNKSITYGLEDVYIAPHKNHIEDGARAWHRYTADQINACIMLCRTLTEHYPFIEYIIGHDDISAGRKIDPSPAFPMELFRQAVMPTDIELPPQVDCAKFYQTITDLNIRKGAGTNFAKIDVLLRGTKLVVLNASGVWVEVVTIENEPIKGWVHSAYIRKVNNLEL